MYAGCSEQYWKERKRANPSKWRNTAIFTIILLSSIGIISQHKRQKVFNEKQKRLLKEKSLFRPIASDEDYLSCGSNVQSEVSSECSALCNNERKSIPRPTMYHACIHGCTSSFEPSILVGCQEASEEEVFRKVGSLSQAHCSRYLDSQPKPEVFSTCRKYHREGTKRGYRIGHKRINDLLDARWLMFKNQYEKDGMKEV